jgi:hypothetical protein
MLNAQFRHVRLTRVGLGSYRPDRLSLRLLLGVGLRDLPHELGPEQVHGAVDDRSLGRRVVVEDLYRQRGVVGVNRARLSGASRSSTGCRTSPQPGWQKMSPVSNIAY